ncbi:nucleoside monophosphate kinase [Patescibacteria group bacterium]|nr:nucleoside monophosphate kinase [Patescibacteria group bacterium]
MDFIFFGMQGAGKGTLGKAVAEKFNMQIFETGGELRKLAQEDSELGKKIKSIIEAGHLVSDEVVMEIVENFMNHLEPGTFVLFDGIPRKVKQGEMLIDLLNKHNRNYKAVLIDITQEEALKRLTTRRICSKCKTVYPADYKNETCEKDGAELITRADDNSDAIKTRLNNYQTETVPAIELFADKLIKIDGLPPILEVREDAIRKLTPIINN